MKQFTVINLELAAIFLFLFQLERLPATIQNSFLKYFHILLQILELSRQANVVVSSIEGITVDILTREQQIFTSLFFELNEKVMTALQLTEGQKFCAKMVGMLRARLNRTERTESPPTVTVH
jgi:hypothetical protein